MSYMSTEEGPGEVQDGGDMLLQQDDYRLEFGRLNTFFIDSCQ